MLQVSPRYSLDIPLVFLRYSPEIFALSRSLSLSPLIEVHTAVNTILGKLPSFKRASRSLAKTGFLLGAVIPGAGLPRGAAR